MKEQEVLEEKKITHAGGLTAILISFLVILIILITGCETAFYLDYDWYMKEYQKQKVQQVVHISDDDLLRVTKYMMSYLRGDKEKLSIVTTVNGKTHDFFNEVERSHMADVRKIFVSCLSIRRYAVSMILLLIIVSSLFRRAPWRKIAGTFLVMTGIFVLLAAGIVIWFCQDFHRGFMAFHKIFFAFDTEKTWLLDRATSNMINILPEGFFLDMAVRASVFIGVYFVIAIVLAVIAKTLTRLHDRAIYRASKKPHTREDIV